jgi:hypothetical protein
MLAALQLAAVAIGTAAALAAERGHGDALYGAAHCTRYAPSVLVRDQTNHPDCLEVGGMGAYNPYQTPSVAWRDHNNISLAGGYNQFWELFLFDTSGNVYQYFAGEGTGMTTAGVSSRQTKAQCSTSPVNPIGRCYTNWHD